MTLSKQIMLLAAALSASSLGGGVTAVQLMVLPRSPPKVRFDVTSDPDALYCEMTAGNDSCEEKEGAPGKCYYKADANSNEIWCEWAPQQTIYTQKNRVLMPKTVTETVDVTSSGDARLES